MPGDFAVTRHSNGFGLDRTADCFFAAQGFAAVDGRRSAQRATVDPIVGEQEVHQRGDGDCGEVRGKGRNAAPAGERSPLPMMPTALNFTNRIMFGKLRHNGPLCGSHLVSSL